MSKTYESAKNPYNNIKTIFHEPTSLILKFMFMWLSVQIESV